MKFQPIHDVVAVQRDKPKAQSIIIEIPDTVRKPAWTGKVVAIGPEVTEVAVGDRVYLPMHYSVSAWVDDEHILFYLEEEILAKEVEEGPGMNAESRKRRQEEGICDDIVDKVKP